METCSKHEKKRAQFYCPSCDLNFCNDCLDYKNFNVLTLRFCNYCRGILHSKQDDSTLALDKFPDYIARVKESLLFPLSLNSVIIMIIIGVASSLTHFILGNTIRIVLLVVYSSLIVVCTAMGQKRIERDNFTRLSELFYVGLLGAAAYLLSFLPYFTLVMLSDNQRIFTHFWDLGFIRTPLIILSTLILPVLFSTLLSVSSVNPKDFINFAINFYQKNSKNYHIAVIAIFGSGLAGYIFYWLRFFFTSIPVIGTTLYQASSLYFPFVTARVIGWLLYEHLVTEHKTSSLVEMRENDLQDSEHVHVSLPLPLQSKIEEYLNTDVADRQRELISLYLNYKKYISAILLSAVRLYNYRIGQQNKSPLCKSDFQFWSMIFDKVSTFLYKSSFTKHTSLSIYLRQYFTNSTEFVDGINFYQSVREELSEEELQPNGMSPQKIVHIIDKYIIYSHRKKLSEDVMNRVKPHFEKAIFELIKTNYLINNSTLAYINDLHENTHRRSIIIDALSLMSNNVFAEQVISLGSIECNVKPQRVALFFKYEEDPPLSLFPAYDVHNYQFIELVLAQDSKNYYYRNLSSGEKVHLSSFFIQYSSIIAFLLGQEQLSKLSFATDRSSIFSSATMPSPSDVVTQQPSVANEVIVRSGDDLMEEVYSDVEKSYHHQREKPLVKSSQNVTSTSSISASSTTKGTDRKEVATVQAMTGSSLEKQRIQGQDHRRSVTYGMPKKRPKGLFSLGNLLIGGSTVIVLAGVFFFIVKPILNFDENMTETRESLREQHHSPAKTKATLTPKPGSHKKHKKGAKIPASIDFAEIYDAVADTIVSINSIQRFGNKSIGTGFVVSDDGLIVTNNHVIDQVDTIQVIFKNNAKYSATIEEILPHYDLALLKVDGHDFTYLEIGDATKASVGDQVIAIGNPLGLSSTLTKGIISYLGREYDKISVIQIDVPVNPGNSGGPLINHSGKVIGVVTAGLLFLEGINFAVPSNYLSYFSALKDTYRSLSTAENETFNSWIDDARGPSSVASKTIDKLHLIVKEDEDSADVYIVFVNEFGLVIDPFESDSAPSNYTIDCNLYHHDNKTSLFYELESISFYITAGDIKTKGTYYDEKAKSKQAFYYAKLGRLDYTKEGNSVTYGLDYTMDRKGITKNDVLAIQLQLSGYNIFSDFEPYQIIIE